MMKDFYTWAKYPSISGRDGFYTVHDVEEYVNGPYGSKASVARTNQILTFHVNNLDEETRKTLATLSDQADAIHRKKSYPWADTIKKIINEVIRPKS